MNLQMTWVDDTLARLEVSADAKELATIKEKVLKRLAPSVKVAGFRAGHTPPEMVEKQLGNQLQSEVLDEALNTMYLAAVRKEALRPSGKPEVSVKAFVPYTQLDCTFEVSCIGEVKLGDYKKLKATLKSEKITDKDIKQVLDNLATRAAEKKDVKRASKTGDEVWIDFAGKDSKGKPIERADGKDYPLLLGSKTFIPGFEENLVGFKAGDKTSFTVTFPKDYGSKELQNKKVMFDVTVNKVQEVITPKHDDEFAKKMGPFKDIAQLKGDIRTQLQYEKDEALMRDYEAEVVREIAAKTKVALPQNIIDEQASVMVSDFKRDLATQGQTWAEYLKSQNQTEEEYLKNVVKPAAEERIRAGIALSEIAEKEGLSVSREELDARIAELKDRYTDEQMRSELDKVENQQDIAARILSEKTIKFLTGRK